MIKEFSNGNTIERDTTIFQPIKVTVELKDPVELSSYIEAIRRWDDELYETLTKLKETNEL